MSRFYSDEMVGANQKRVKMLTTRAQGISFDRPHLRASINQANEILRTCYLDKSTLNLVSMTDVGVKYSIRGASEGVSLAFSFHFTGGSLESPSTRLSQKRVELLDGLGLGTAVGIPLVPPIDRKRLRFSDEIAQHMRVLAVTRQARAERGVPQLNHTIGYGIFSSSERISDRQRNSQRLRERLMDVMNHFHSRGIDPTDVFMHIEWRDRKSVV